MIEPFETSFLPDDRIWQSDRRQWIAAAGMAFTGGLPWMLCANQVEGQPPISASLADKYEAIRFGLRLSRLEWTARLIDGVVIAGGTIESNAMALRDLGNYYQGAWTAAQAQFDWAKTIAMKHDAEISALVGWAISRYPLSNDMKATLANSTGKVGGPAKVAVTSVERLRDVGISAAEARRAAQEKTGVPKDEDPQRRSAVACSLIGSQLIAAALSGQWELLTTILVKLQISGCL